MADEGAQMIIVILIIIIAIIIIIIIICNSNHDFNHLCVQMRAAGLLLVYHSNHLNEYPKRETEREAEKRI